MGLLDRLRGKRMSPSDTTLGGILLAMGLITKEELLDAITVKMTTSGEQLLGEVLIARGAITRAQLERVLVMQRERRGEKVDYGAEAARLALHATKRAEYLHASLDNLESVAREVMGLPKNTKSH